MRGRYWLNLPEASGYGGDLLPQRRKGTALQRFIASLTIVTLVSWTALAVLPAWFNTAVLAVLIVFVAVVGLIKLVLIALTPP